MASSDNRSVILVSIKPKFAEAILTGNKAFELRRVSVDPNVRWMALYATAPVKRIVGWCEVARVVRDDVDALWGLVSGRAGVSRDEFYEYFSGVSTGVAIEIRRSYPTNKHGMHLELVTGGRPPQSFRYIDRSEGIGTTMVRWARRFLFAMGAYQLEWAEAPRT